MNPFKQKFADFTSEYLLQMRARGSELSDEAHRAIEEIFAERGEHLPPKPKRPISLTDKAVPTSGIEKVFKSASLIFLALVALVIANTFAHTWIGILIAIGVILYFVVNWFRRRTLTPAQKEAEDNEKKAQEEGLSEVMVCAADGDLKRLRELVAYGEDINARSLSGATALMYATRNNRPDIVRFLLSAGANPSVKSEKGLAAIDIARKFNHLEIAALLEQQHGAR